MIRSREYLNAPEQFFSLFLQERPGTLCTRSGFFFELIYLLFYNSVLIDAMNVYCFDERFRSRSSITFSTKPSINRIYSAVKNSSRVLLVTSISCGVNGFPSSSRRSRSNRITTVLNGSRSTRAISAMVSYTSFGNLTLVWNFSSFILFFTMFAFYMV